MIKFTEPLAKEFKQAYLRAKARKQEIFDYHGQEVLVTYAKYLVEHLETNIFKKTL